MPHSQPQRPFIPHRTPKKSQPLTRAAEFRISKPFVPGSQRVAPELVVSQAFAAVSAPESGKLPGIEDFLQLEPSGGSQFAATEEQPDELDEDELPPVEHFLDPLPPVSEFAAGEAAYRDLPPAGSEYAARGESGSDTAESGWIETDWQNYDWSAAAALGETGSSDASNAWATTDWDVGAPRAGASRPTAAQAIANALDQIAERIRTGELAVPAAEKMTDPASFAAAVAAMLGIRQ